MVKGPSECGTRVPDRKCDEVHPSPISFEGRHKGGVLRVLLVELIFAAKVFAEANLDYDDGALLHVEGGRVGRGGGVSWTPLA